MNDILILHYYKSIVDGVMTSMIDTFFNLRLILTGFRDVKINIICPELYLLDRDDYYDEEKYEWYEYKNETELDVIPYKGDYNYLNFQFRALRNEVTTAVPFLRFNRNFGDFNLVYSIVKDENIFEAKTIICSARLIYEILMGADIELKCDKIIVLDSLDTYRSKIGIFPDFDNLFDTMLKNSEVVQLSNPANLKETNYKQKTYYQKFSIRRLNALRQSGNLKEKYIFDRTKKEKTKIDKLGHFENMGKGIFEHLWFNKPVHYKTNGMFTKDGLCFYMDLIDIDFKKEQVIKNIPKEKLRLLFMDYLREMKTFNGKLYVKDELIKEAIK